MTDVFRINLVMTDVFMTDVFMTDVLMTDASMQYHSRGHTNVVGYAM